MRPALTHAEPLPDRILAVSFDNGFRGFLDLTPFLDFGVFHRLQDPAQFQKVRIAFGTVEWECGVDLDPEYLLSHATQ